MNRKVISLLIMGALLITVGAVVPATASENSNTLVVAHSEYAFNFDTLYTTWGDIGRLAMVAYDSLVKYDPSSKEVVPWVAKGWDISQDGLTYTFYLNKGIKFHDGTELTVTDVEFTAERDRELYGDTAMFFSGVTSIEEVDDYTIKLTLEKPNSEFLLGLCGFYIISKDGVKAQDQEGDSATKYLQNYDLGSGPYRVVLNVPEQRTICEKFPDYWKGWEGNHIDKILWLWIKESATQRMMLESGQLDIAMNPSVADLPSFERNPELSVHNDTSHIVMQLDFRTIHKPLDDVRVRKALAMTIDYDYLLEVTTGGYGIRANSPIASVLPYHNSETPLVPYDMDAAKKLLAEAGYPNGGFNLIVGYQSEHSEYRRLLELLEQNWGELGITVQPMSMDYNAQYEMQKDKNSKPDIWMTNIWPFFAAPYEILKEFYWGPLKGVLGQNASYWSDPKVDKLIEDGIAALDPSKAEANAEEAQQLIAEACPTAWICEQPYIIVTHDYVKGYVYNPMYHQAVDVYHMVLEGKP